MSNLDDIAKEHYTSVQLILDKVNDGLAGVSISHFTDGQLAVIKAALEIAGEL